jgi:hypothetical protein
LLGRSREAEIVFQLAPDLTAHVNGPDCVVSRNARPVASLSFLAAGSVAVGLGRVSPAFGRMLTVPRVVWTGEVDERGVAIRVVRL